MLEEKDGVIAAYPHGDTKMVEIHAAKAGTFSEASLKKLVESNEKFKLTSFRVEEACPIEEGQAHLSSRE